MRSDRLLSGPWVPALGLAPSAGMTRPIGGETGRGCHAIEPSRLLPCAADGQRSSAPPAQRHPPHLRRHAAAGGRGAVRVAPGERVCLVGRNGSGKSTLLRIAAGLIEPDRGERFVQPGATIRYLPQEPDLAGLCRPRWPMSRRASGPPTIRIGRAICCSSSGSTARRTRPSLSGGELRRAALARVLAPEPDILLLDEPTNHLDLPAIEWLEARLAEQRGALVLISHDRRFLENLSRTTVWLDRGRTRRVEHRLSRLRGLARRAAGRGGGGPAQARPQDRARGALGALRRHRAAQAQRAAHGASCRRCARPAATYRSAAGTAAIAASDGGARRASWWSRPRASPRRSAGRPIVADFSHAHPARRPHRHRRAQRQRQDHAGQPAHRRAGARQRHGPARRQPGDGDARPGAREPRSRLDAGRGADRRPRRHGHGRRPAAGTSSAT